MKLIKAAVAIGLVAFVFTAIAAAQNLRASVPFDFAVNGQVLPAGEYSIALDPIHQRIEVQRIGGTEQVYIIYMFKNYTRPATAAMVFATFGEAHFLRTIRSYDQSWEMPPSKLERQVAKQDRGTLKEVALVRNTQ